MPLQTPLDSTDEDYVDIKLFPPVQRNMHQTYLGVSSDVQVMTMDRNFAQNFKKISNSNAYGTLPRSRITNEKAIRAKVQTIGAISNLYLNNKEENIIEEEFKYLRAVESGNLELVEKILSSCENIPADVTSHDSSVTGNGLQIKVTSEKITSHFNPTFVDEKQNNSAKPAQNLIEMFEFDEGRNADAKKSALPLISNNEPARSTIWPGSGSPRSPLPVTLMKKNDSEDYLCQQLEDDMPRDALGFKKKSKFNKNCRDQWGRSALFIAMIHHNLDMLKLLLRYEVKSDECLYHAIDFGYYDIVDTFMRYDKDKTQMVTGELSFYSPGLTPFQLAAHKNDFVMLRILHDHGYRITEECRNRALSARKSNSSFSQLPVLDRAWDASNHQLLYYRAISSPAYLIMTFDEGLKIDAKNTDFLESIFSLYGELKQKLTDDPAVQSLYQPLADRVEEFACDLLSEVRSSSDLANLLRFDPPGQRRLTSQRNYLTPVQRAIEVRMKRFVAHENSQLAVSSLRLGTLFDTEQSWRTYIKRSVLALIFPILCLAFSVAPNSKIGAYLCNPIVNMTCHIMSDIIFLVLMLVRLISITVVYECDCLGTAIYPIDYVIWLWVFARIVNQIKKFREVPIKEMLRNVWTVNDLTTSLLFLIVIAIKIYNVSVNLETAPNFCPATVPFNSSKRLNFLQQNNITHNQFEVLCTRSKWTADQVWLITIAEAALAIIYFLIHIRAMELLYTDRTFGPLQLSLDKMFLDTIRFLFIFFVTFAGFAFAMTQLYWAWGKPASFAACGDSSAAEIPRVCSQDTNPSSSCLPVYSSILNSILEQYWTLYGYGWAREPPSAAKIPCNNNGDHKGITEIAGEVVSMIFHAWAVVVMLNVLVAMLSHSFDRVRNNAELEWKFHRTRTWMKFIRKGVYPRPPPMNLIPSTRDIRSLRNFIKKRFVACCPERPTRHNAQRESSEGSQRENHQYRQALKNITHRYTRRYLLPDFQHKELEQQLATGRRGSVSIADESCA